jgi:hypothetical protein
MPAPTRDTVITTLTAYVDGINNEDAAAMTALFAPDARHHEPIDGPVRNGADLREFFDAAVDPNLRVRQLGPITVHAGHAVLQLEVLVPGMDPFATTDIFEVDEQGLVTYFAAIPDVEARTNNA